MSDDLSNGREQSSRPSSGKRRPVDPFGEHLLPLDSFAALSPNSFNRVPIGPRFCRVRLPNAHRPQTRTGCVPAESSARSHSAAQKRTPMAMRSNDLHPPLLSSLCIEPDMLPKPIGIAIVECNGRYLIGTRTVEQSLAGAAEFPGGKCNPDETPAACAVRECLEETGLTIEPVRLLERVQFDYPHASVDLHFWLCREVAPSTEPLNSFRWVTRDELRALAPHFPAANAAVVKRLLDSE